MKKEIKFHDTLKQQKVKTFETLYTVPVSVDKSKTIAMNATLQEQKPLVSGVTDFFVMSLPIFSDSSTRVDVLFDRYLFIYLFIDSYNVQGREQ